MAINEEFPILEHLIIMTPRGNKSTYDLETTVSGTLQASHLRHLALIGFFVYSQPGPGAMGFVTLTFVVSDRPPIHPTTLPLLQWLSFMPQLETRMLIITIIF